MFFFQQTGKYLFENWFIWTVNFPFFFCEVGLFCWTFVHRKLNCNIRALTFNFQCFIKCKSNQIDWQNSLPNQSAIIDLTLRVYLRGCSISIYSIYSFGLHIQITNRFYFEIWLIDFFCYSADRIGNITISKGSMWLWQKISTEKHRVCVCIIVLFLRIFHLTGTDELWLERVTVIWFFDCLMLEIQWK